MRYTKSAPTAVLALLFAAACDMTDAPVGPQPGPAGSKGALPPQAQAFTSDDEYARASRAEAPGFAGFYLRNDGTPVVLLTDPGQRGAVQRYLAQELAATRRGRLAGAPQQPVFVKAAYDFAQLKEWSEQLTPMLSRSDVY